MLRPPTGLCAPVAWVRNRDGDTVEVRLRTGQVAAIRLADIDCPELATEAGRRAKAFLDALFEQSERSEKQRQMYVFIPQLDDSNGDGILDVKEILRQMSFDRIPGHVFLGDDDVGDELVRRGHAVSN